MPPVDPTNNLGREREVLRPAQLNALARDLLEGSFPMVWVEAEISNLSQPASGHLYFSLKDDRAQVRCALFRQRASRIGFRPGNGQLVLARGRLTLYEPRGDYQLVLDHLEPAGAGALRAAYEALRGRLAAEGLFDATSKPALPRFVRRLGVLTSPRGAAVRDVISVLGRRFGLLEVDVLPIPVQGEGAAASIVQALQWAQASGRYDALLLTRGGGSLEDLWSFNDETLVRQLAASRIPVVVAIGHETDVTLAEFAATLRAPTPSAAAELLVPEQGALFATLAHLDRRQAESIRRRLAWASQGLDRCALRLQAGSPRRRLELGAGRLAELVRRRETTMRRLLERGEARLSRARSSLGLLHPGRGLATFASRIGRLHDRLRLAGPGAIDDKRRQLDATARALHAVGPLATLERGFAILRDAGDGHVLRSRAELTEGRMVRAQLADGDAILRAVATPPAQRRPDPAGSGKGGPKK